MGRFCTAMRGWIGKLTDAVRGWSASLWAKIKEGMGAMPPRRIVALVVALSLWMGVGGMDSSESVTETEGEVFGELHRYPPEPPYGMEGDG